MLQNVTGYEVWRATSPKGKYTKIKTLKTNSYKNTGLTINKNYYYKVRSYVKINNKIYYSPYTSVINEKPGFTAPTSIKTSWTNSSIKLTWKSVSKATNYKIYRSSTKNGKYKLIKTTKKTSYKDSNVTKGKTYYYKIVASGTINKKTYSSPASSIITGLARRPYLKPDITIFFYDYGITYDNMISILLINNGSKDLEILGDAFIMDNSKKRKYPLQLVDTFYTGKDIKSFTMSGEYMGLVAYRFKGSKWYDKKGTTTFNFIYDGKKYTGYISEYDGFYFK